MTVRLVEAIARDHCEKDNVGEIMQRWVASLFKVGREKKTADGRKRERK